MTYVKRTWKVLRNAVNGFIADDCMTMAAALALYAIFSLPPLLLTITIFAGSIWGENLIQGQIETVLNGVVGEVGTKQIIDMMYSISIQKSGWIAYLGSYIVLFVGATGVLMQLQAALNRIWRDTKHQSQMSILFYIVKRAFSMLLILAAGLLMLATLMLTAFLNYFSKVAEPVAHLQSGALQNSVQTVVTLALLTVIIAMTFQWLPDDPARRRDVYRGALITAILITLGKDVFAVYLATFNTSTSSTSGALVSLILWIYYSCNILLFGAELTKHWSIDKLQQRQKRQAQALSQTHRHD